MPTGHKYVFLSNHADCFILQCSKVEDWGRPNFMGMGFRQYHLKNEWRKIYLSPYLIRMVDPYGVLIGEE